MKMIAEDGTGRSKEIVATRHSAASFHPVTALAALARFHSNPTYSRQMRADTEQHRHRRVLNGAAVAVVGGGDESNDVRNGSKADIGDYS